MGFGFADISKYVVLTIALVFGLTLHEFAHAWTAVQLGDPTPRSHGRLTLNPRAHLDVLGTLLFYIAGIGWAKPVPYNPYNLRVGVKQGGLLVSAAGPLMNLLVAIIAAALLRFILVPVQAPRLLITAVSFIASFNILLSVFNLLPIAPLDGFRVLVGLLPYPWSYEWARFEQYGPLILMFLILSGSFLRVNVLWWIIGLPIQVLERVILGV
ncbi:MAG: hypothetical protein A2Z04_03745 [Chloroflexi bacterium RBG_16_57_9]|nr:MAG: hypothetical protein A2Z04_03745 [Chloroflexi bacterium RBG_16_57_9]